jgi:hypothetical protein
VKNLSGAPLEGRFLASPTNIRLGWNGLSETTTLAFWAHILVIKTFMNIPQGAHPTDKF